MGHQRLLQGDSHGAATKRGFADRLQSYLNVICLDLGVCMRRAVSQESRVMDDGRGRMEPRDEVISATESWPGAATLGNAGCVTGVITRLSTRDMRPDDPMASAMCGMGSAAAAAAACTWSACAGSVAVPTNLATAAAPSNVVACNDLMISAVEGIGPRSWWEPTIWMPKREARATRARMSTLSRLASRSSISTPARRPTSQSRRYSESEPSNLPPSALDRIV
eukprot:scaffold59922_cov31-Tisochrysis_lutea.AAC.4